MRLVLQRVSSASVGWTERRSARSAAVCWCWSASRAATATRGGAAAAEKLAGLRCFEDDAGKMNLDPRGVGGAFLVVSQFTLAGSLERDGGRPSTARRRRRGRAAGRALVEELRGARLPRGDRTIPRVMEVTLVNDGPVTFVDSEAILRRLAMGNSHPQDSRSPGTGMNERTKIDERRRRRGSLRPRDRAARSRPAPAGGETPNTSDDARTRSASPASRSRARRRPIQNGERQPALQAAERGIEDVPAVELAQRQQVERGGEEAEPGGQREGVEVRDHAFRRAARGRAAPSAGSPGCGRAARASHCPGGPARRSDRRSAATP